MPLPSTRQSASAFNQPLSLDTSKVTTMYGMFEVRPARALTLTPSVGPSPRVHAACAATTSHPPASWPAPRPASHAPPFDSRQSMSAFNQPLSLDTSKVTNMDYMFYVRPARALAPNSLESGLRRACRLRRRRPTPSRLPARTSPRIACPSLRLGRTCTPSTSR